MPKFASDSFEAFTGNSKKEKKRTPPRELPFDHKYIILEESNAYLEERRAYLESLKGPEKPLNKLTPKSIYDAEKEITKSLLRMADQSMVLEQKTNQIIDTIHGHLPMKETDLLEDFNDTVHDNVADIIQDFDITDSKQVMMFATAAQNKLNKLSEQMLDKVTSDEVGAAGEILANMLDTMTDFKFNPGPQTRLGKIKEFFKKTNHLEVFIKDFNLVKSRIDSISLTLHKHKNNLFIDVERIDKLYEALLEYYNTLKIYIDAGEQILAKARAELEERKKTAASGDLIDIQKVKDFEFMVTNFERRLLDVKLTRQVTMQSLPSMRIVQENDKVLIARIHSTLTNTIPLWKNQLAQAVTIQRSANAANTLREANNLTNSLLKNNASHLKESNRIAQEQNERGLFDIEAIEEANQELISTIQDSLKIYEEGNKKRQEVHKRLLTCETELKGALNKSKITAIDAPVEQKESLIKTNNHYTYIIKNSSSGYYL